jgi:hypothetical protein
MHTSERYDCYLVVRIVSLAASTAVTAIFIPNILLLASLPHSHLHSYSLIDSLWVMGDSYYISGLPRIDTHPFSKALPVEMKSQTMAARQIYHTLLNSMCWFWVNVRVLCHLFPSPVLALHFLPFGVYWRTILWEIWCAFVKDKVWFCLCLTGYLRSQRSFRLLFIGQMTFVSYDSLSLLFLHHRIIYRPQGGEMKALILVVHRKV